MRGAPRRRNVLAPGDTLAQNLAGPDNQNELPGPTKDITVEMHEGTNMAAFPSPDGTKMVLSLQGGLWVISASGGTATKITPWNVEATQPAWSPDGQWIAFQNYSTEANYAIWVVKSDGSQLHALTSGPFDDREPSWYPDSSKVIFSSDRSDDKQYKIWSVTLGGALQQLTTGTGAESNPVVSPDGTKIAFVDNGNTIRTMPANLSAAPTTFGSGNYPQWTPNSAGLVYQNTAGNLVVNGKPRHQRRRSVPVPRAVHGRQQVRVHGEWQDPDARRRRRRPAGHRIQRDADPPATHHHPAFDAAEPRCHPRPSRSRVSMAP
jgi:dipeptidyl aminopeptidase/acylaminoacyl peptidase